MIAQFLFFLLAIVAVTAALGMLLSRNPVTSALWLILNLFCIAGLYLTLHAQFIAVIQVLVYAGAIMVLFLFVIMLLNLAALPAFRQVDLRRGVAFVLVMGVLAELAYITAMAAGVLPEPVPPEQAAQTGYAAEIAKELFTRYALPFEMVGVLLLAATIGAVMFAKRRFV
ncbi:NADH-quinone oxidoreductase subunit J [Rhodocaloribacter litoris]|uniref:NADH-quinone oxidoreductase subunit J family protein n=1 Tax=Rhodocaloribacter litoris TaxID=2558931 RepID=UPI00141F1524|nr:NADH-quinone oxidoreductase subunit J [Rhodocaloribacter litoris]QXD14995.1 NADH-quinone oxidoreductase subunit J [Rhodocaloribacter litoris]GIV62218.1 MAG: NADH dehydrogenase [Rhodothermaceae bacterium]